MAAERHPSTTEAGVVHDGSVPSVARRDLLVQARHRGGVSLSDGTDASKPVELACVDRRPDASGGCGVRPATRQARRSASGDEPVGRRG